MVPHALHTVYNCFAFKLYTENLFGLQTDCKKPANPTNDAFSNKTIFYNLVLGGVKEVSR